MMNTNFFPNMMMNPAELAEKAIDQWVNSYSFFSRFQDQADAATRTWLDQSRTAREQGHKVVVQVAEQIKQNQRLFQDMAVSSVSLLLETQRVATQRGMTEMSKQLDTMSKFAQTKVAAN